MSANKRIVLIGGGHAHVHVIKSYGEQPLRSLIESNGISLILVTNTLHTPYSGMLPGFVSGHYTHSDIHIDLQRLCDYGGFTLIHDSAIGVTYNDEDGDGGGGGRVQLENGEPIPYDVLSIDVGSSPGGGLPNYEDTEDDTPAAIPVKPISTFCTRYDELKSRLRESAKVYTKANPFVLLVVGGGAGGIELALSCQFSLKGVIRDAGGDADAIQIILATRGNVLLESHNKKVQNIFARIMKERGVKVHYNTNVIGVKKVANSDMKALKLSDDKAAVDNTCSNATDSIAFHECLWCTSAGAASWLSGNTPFTTTEEGFVKVGSTYECTDHPRVFAAGDCCHFVESPRPKAGVFAVRAGPILRDNILAAALGRPLISHKPQSNFLSLLSTGDKYAVASRGRFAFEGGYLWKLKDHIDTKWMSAYQDI